MRPLQRQYIVTPGLFACVESHGALWPWLMLYPRTSIADGILDLQQSKSSSSEGLAFLQPSRRLCNNAMPSLSISEETSHASLMAMGRSNSWHRYLILEWTIGNLQFVVVHPLSSHLCCFHLLICKLIFGITSLAFPTCFTFSRPHDCGVRFSFPLRQTGPPLSVHFIPF